MSRFGLFVLAVLAVAVAAAIGYFVGGCRADRGEAPSEWRISQHTAGRTAEDLGAYKRRIGELERENAKLLAAVQADFVAPATTTFHEGEVPAGEPNVLTLTWTWLERGGGSGIADFDERDVRMDWNKWKFAVDVELTREADGRLGATVSTNELGLTLEQTRFYADDPWKERWYEKFEAGVAGGYGDGFTAQAHFGYRGWNVYVQRSGLFEPERGDTTVKFGKTVRFF